LELPRFAGRGNRNSILAEIIFGSSAMRKPSLMRVLRNAEKAGREVTAASVRPDGTIVLQFEHNLGDNSPPTLPSGNEWDEVLKQ
jgi:hypothetical protein